MLELNKNENNKPNCTNNNDLKEPCCEVEGDVSKKLAKSGYKIYGMLAAISFIIYGLATIINIRLKTYNEPLVVSMSYVQFDFKDIYILIFIGVMYSIILFYNKSNFNIIVWKEGQLRKPIYIKNQKILCKNYLKVRIIFILVVLILFNPIIIENPLTIFDLYYIKNEITWAPVIYIAFLLFSLNPICSIMKSFLRKINKKYDPSKDTDFSLITPMIILIIIFCATMKTSFSDRIEATSGVRDDIKKYYDYKSTDNENKKIITTEFKNKFDKFDEEKSIYFFKETEEYFYYINDGRVFQVKKFKD